MGRLIDADKLKKDILSQSILGETMGKVLDRYIQVVDSQPTAFDLDKVVARLEAYSNEDEAERLGTIPVIELTDAIEIVKGGGVNG